MKPRAKVRITSPSGYGRDTHVELDGTDISKACRSAIILADARDMVTVTLDLVYIETEFDGAARIKLPDATVEALLKLGWSPPTGASSSDAHLDEALLSRG